MCGGWRDNVNRQKRKNVGEFLRVFVKYVIAKAGTVLYNTERYYSVRCSACEISLTNPKVKEIGMYER